VTAAPPPETDAVTVAPASLPLASTEQTLPAFPAGQYPVADETSNVDLGTSHVNLDATSVMFNDFPATFEWDWNESLNLDPSFYLTDTNFTYVDGLAFNGISQIVSSANQPLAATASTPIVERRSESPMGLLGRKSTILQIYRQKGATLTCEADNDDFRDNLANSLDRRTPNVPLPPTSFLNRCIHTFTTRLWPLVPIIHLPTFDPSRTHPLLLLSICSLGALADGSDNAIRYSERLFEGVRKAIMVSSLTSTVGGADSLEKLQAVAIGQTYAFLSGDPLHLMMARAFHSSFCVAVQALHLRYLHSKSKEARHQSDQLSWQQWIKEESLIRLLNVGHIHNAEIAATTRRSASMRAEPWNILTAAPDQMFLAKDFDQWKIMRNSDPRAQFEPHSRLSGCAILATLSSEISHCKIGPFVRSGDDEVTQKVIASLVAWIERFPTPGAVEASTRAMILMLWHSCFLLVFSDVDATERLPNFDTKNDNSSTTIERLTRWKNPETARRCTVHALMILQLLKCLRISDVPGIHVARASWQAGLVLAAYASYAPQHHSPIEREPNIPLYSELDAVRKLSPLEESDWIAVSRKLTPSKCIASAHVISSTLRSLGPWGDARYYAADVDKLLVFVET
jgi:hypothetical protein